MSMQEKNLDKLRNVINENLRTQIGNDKVNYISTGHTLSDVTAKQSHCIFARRGCGKTLLLHHSRRQLDTETRAIYINCEDFKHHSFPNVLIELLDATFRELDRNLLGWFGKSKKLKAILTDIRSSLMTLRQAPDQQSIEVKAALSEHAERKTSGTGKIGAKVHSAEASISAGSDRLFKSSSDIERKYVHNENKLQQLNHNLPSYKTGIRDFFSISAKLRSVFIQIDDFYHLNRTDQPFVADYIHRLCKDTPLKFKIATLRHNSVMYIERAGQPIGIQERHDYQPINIDFTFEHFDRTLAQNRGIFLEYCKLAGMTPADFDALFKGKGFDRLVLAGGGVPRDCMSFFLEVLDRVRTADPAGKIGKDDVRFLSKETFERRIDELKQDSEGQDQDTLLRAYMPYAVFASKRKATSFLSRKTKFKAMTT
ncbi:hypothetical protein AB3X82_13310 [Paraburkholderia phenoliruptrix]|uniref:Uncharacterized protein n=1 Tax=Paraburkholderia phenoliruptrix TaxID=252970 RepID=A0ABV3WBD3_9BURK|nr:hypothetical protein [Paraburkholderia phenoliruptrix]MDR6388557.1 hypothetical protein [Paraburkholderia phenoliruptrix]